MNDNGTKRHFGSDSDYITDVLKRQTQQFIGTSVAQGKPFFAYVAPKARMSRPHRPRVTCTPTTARRLRAPLLQREGCL